VTDPMQRAAAGVRVDPEPSEDPERVRILVADDEESITDVLSVLLRHAGFAVRTASTGREALALSATFLPEVVVLDVMMPDLDGFEVCRRLRADGSRAPILFLSARDEVADKVAGLEGGGDDYVTKPFSLEELLARIRAAVRRSRPDDGDRLLRYEDLELDEARHQVRRAGTPVRLSPTEFTVLHFLMVNAEKVVSKDQILDHVWQYHFGEESTVVETYISYVRKKLDPLGPPLIETVRGVGYSLRRPTDS
jgi:two-component system OmpR family response regulator